MEATSTEWVRIIVNGQPHRMHPGPHTGSQVKSAGQVPAADELSQVLGGKLVFIADDAKIIIVGEETFVSNPPSGGSS